MVLALMIVDPIIEKHGQECVLTSGVEGKHSKKTSKHYAGCGTDLRSRDMPDKNIKSCVDDMKEALGEEFYVAFEGNHFHISYNGSIK